MSNNQFQFDTDRKSFVLHFVFVLLVIERVTHLMCGFHIFFLTWNYNCELLLSISICCWSMRNSDMSKSERDAGMNFDWMGFQAHGMDQTERFAYANFRHTRFVTNLATKDWEFIFPLRQFRCKAQCVLFFIFIDNLTVIYIKWLAGMGVVFISS